jgi:hypothetical protein
MKTYIKKTLNGYSVEVSRAQDEELAFFLNSRGAQVIDIVRPMYDKNVSVIRISHAASITKKSIEDIITDFETVNIKSAV